MRHFMRFSLAAILLSGINAIAQSTAVTMTVTDPSGQLWTNATVSYQFQGNGSFYGQYQWQGANLPTQYLTKQSIKLNSSAYGTFTVPSSNEIFPAGSSWLITVCPNVSTKCQTMPTALNGSSEDISAFIDAFITTPSITVSNVPLIYNTNEVLSSFNQGALIYNTTTQAPMYYTGSNWANFAAGSVTSVNAGTMPSFLSLLVATNTTTPTLNFTSSTIPVSAGGTGVVTGTGYAYGNGTSPFTFSTTIPYANLSGAPTIPTTSSWPDAGTCTSGQYMTATTNGAAPTCAQVAYSQISSPPTIPTITGTLSASSVALSTIYQNTSGVIELIAVTGIIGSGSGDSTLTISIGATSPPSTYTIPNTTTSTISGENITTTFMVPTSYYWEASATNIITSITAVTGVL